jgi:protein ImuB
VGPMACIDLPAFPLQILLRRRPEWRNLPAAVIDEDRPQGLLLWVNERARTGRVLSGMRYAAALSVMRDLRAGVVSTMEIEAEVAMVMQRLHFFSPEVEHAHDDPGTFWLGAEGLGLLHPSFPHWAGMIRNDLAQAGYDGRVAVGFSHFGSYAAARVAGSEVVVFRDLEDERVALRGIPIERIACNSDFRDTLARLGIFSLGEFVDLPLAGVRRRFGEEAYLLHRRARGDTWTPLKPEIPEEPNERRVVLDTPETNPNRLLCAMEEDLYMLLAGLHRNDRALASLTVEFGFDRPGAHGERHAVERLRPAKPTCDAGLLINLLRLRLESACFPAGVVDVRIEAEWVAAGAEQISIFADRHRDLEAANRALARVRAEFGEGSVCVPVLREAHLPEARVVLEPLERLAAAQSRQVRTPPLVRRILVKATPISLSWPAERPVGTDNLPGVRIAGFGLIVEAVGPYAVSGGWWRRTVSRRYWYVRVVPTPWSRSRYVDRSSRSHGDTGDVGSTTPQTSRASDGAWLWIYQDARQRWLRQGEVE